MRIELTTEPGDPQRPNEDYASVAAPAAGTGGALVVLDGVTPPAGDVGCAHGVPWFTSRLGGALLERAGSPHGLPLAECLRQAVARTAATHASTCDLSHPRTPQATVVAARWDARAVEYLVLSDSVLLLERPGGTVSPVRDTRLESLPPYVGELRRYARSLPEGSPERTAAADRYVDAVEGLRNAAGREGAFWTAAADPGVADRAVTGEVPRGDVRSLVALTDGASRWTETFRLGDWAGLAALVRSEGPAGLVRRVREAERAAPAGRGKRHDDATAVLVEL